MVKHKTFDFEVDFEKAFRASPEYYYFGDVPAGRAEFTKNCNNAWLSNKQYEERMAIAEHAEQARREVARERAAKQALINEAVVPDVDIEHLDPRLVNFIVRSGYCQEQSPVRGCVTTALRLHYGGVPEASNDYKRGERTLVIGKDYYTTSQRGFASCDHGPYDLVLYSALTNFNSDAVLSLVEYWDARPDEIAYLAVRQPYTYRKMRILTKGMPTERTMRWFSLYAIQRNVDKVIFPESIAVHNSRTDELKGGVYDPSHFEQLKERLGENRCELHYSYLGRLGEINWDYAFAVGLKPSGLVFGNKVDQHRLGKMLLRCIFEPSFLEEQIAKLQYAQLYA